MNECIICFDDNNIKEIILLSSFVRNCKCNYTTHLECMEKWIDTNPSCPLCKKLITYNSNIDMSQCNYERDNVSVQVSNRIEKSLQDSPLLHDPTHSIEMNISKRKYYIKIILWIIVILLLFIVINLLL